MESLKNKVTIITGAGSGFGRATANFFTKYGAKLVIVDMNLETAEETKQLCISSGLTDDNVLTVRADITSDEDRKSIVNECIVKFGRIDVFTMLTQVREIEGYRPHQIALQSFGETLNLGLLVYGDNHRLNITLYMFFKKTSRFRLAIDPSNLVNNAGIYRAKKLTETAPELYDLVMDVNLKAQIFLTQLAIPYLKQTKGNIVNMSSIAAKEPIVMSGAYTISKAALDMFTKALALEMAEFGVRVNSVRPGTMHTNLYDFEFGDGVEARMEQTVPEHPLGRLGTPEDIAHAVGFLASDLSAYSTGNTFFVDGGRHCVGARHGVQTQALKQQK